VACSIKVEREDQIQRNGQHIKEERIEITLKRIHFYVHEASSRFNLSSTYPYLIPEGHTMKIHEIQAKWSCQNGDRKPGVRCSCSFSTAQRHVASQELSVAAISLSNFLILSRGTQSGKPEPVIVIERSFQGRVLFINHSVQCVVCPTSM
jgi:hypothetical protein